MIGNYDNELKNKISEMEQGRFQHLGDDIVKAHFGKVPQSLGSQLGTDKTKAGTPDSFIAFENGKFILIEYTTTESQGKNKSKLCSKMKKDIEACLNPNKCHITPDKIEEILCVYNSNCLDSGDVDSLKEYLKSLSQENILLVIWGIDDLLDTIVNKDPVLAEKYFGLSIWDNQLVSPNQFIREYNRSNGILQIPMDTKLIAREQELKDIQEYFNSCRALILTGDPGVGKTRLALEIACFFKEKGYQAFCMTIFQPRRDNVSTYEMTKGDLLQWAEKVLKPTAALAAKGEGEYKAGEHCRFCKIRATCRKRAEYNLELARYDFAMPSTLCDAEVEAVLEKADDLVAWVGDIKDYALQQALSGKAWTGWKLVEGRSNRRYVDDDAVAAKVEEAGYSPYEKKLMGITALTHLLGKRRFDELLSGLIEKPQGKPVLVPESDKRPAMHTAVKDFSSEN